MNGIIKLEHLGIIRATGSEASHFLHGQLSSDMEHLHETQARLAAYCSPQGRMLASFIVLKNTPEELLLICAADLLQAILKRLSMFILRTKAKLSDASNELTLYGLVLSAESKPDFDIPATQPWACVQQNGQIYIRLPEVQGQQRYIFLPADPSSAAAPEQPALPEVTWATWQWLEIQSGIPMINDALRDKYIPKMLNYESIGGIDFAKGCYPGQEIISRSQFRGTLKRHTYLIHSEQPLKTGEKILTATDPAQAAGEIIAAAPAPEHASQGGWNALAVLRTSDIEQPLVTQAGKTVKIEPLPYSIKTDF